MTPAAQALTVEDAVSYIDHHGFGVSEEIDKIIIAAATAVVRLHPEASLRCLTLMSGHDESHLSLNGHDCERSDARKTTKFVICGNHSWLGRETRARQAEVFVEGGPGFGKGCGDGFCRLLPGTDLFCADVCSSEMELDWAVNR